MSAAEIVAAIKRNVADLESGLIDWKEFGARQRSALDSVPSTDVKAEVLKALGFAS